MNISNNTMNLNNNTVNNNNTMNAFKTRWTPKLIYLTNNLISHEEKMMPLACTLNLNATFTLNPN
jgi:hypothetical protein